MHVQAGVNAAIEVSFATHSYDTAIQLDLEFLRAWEDGYFPDICCYLRVRQIRNGNPILLAERLLRKMDAEKTHPAVKTVKGPKLVPSTPSRIITVESG